MRINASHPLNARFWTPKFMNGNKDQFYLDGEVKSYLL